MLGLIGAKLGMTRVFADNGEATAVTVLAVGGNRAAQVKTAERDGYDSLQVAFGERRPSRLNSPTKGHLAKHQTGAARALREFRNASLPEGAKSGDDIGAAVFSDGQYVDVCGISRGKGFAGVIKRWHFSFQPRLARQFALAPQARLHRPVSRPGAGVSGQENARTAGRQAADFAKS